MHLYILVNTVHVPAFFLSCCRNFEDNFAEIFNVLPTSITVINHQISETLKFPQLVFLSFYIWALFVMFNI